MKLIKPHDPNYVSLPYYAEGRRRCRVCGQRIVRGALEVEFHQDRPYFAHVECFPDWNSLWTQKGHALMLDAGHPQKRIDTEYYAKYRALGFTDSEIDDIIRRIVEDR